MKLLNVRLKMSKSNHPQSDRQSEVMNRIVEEYLRLFCESRQDNWDQYLATAEFTNSSSTFVGTGLSPFYMNLGWEPKSPLDLLHQHYGDGNNAVEELKVILQELLKMRNRHTATFEGSSVSRSQITSRLHPIRRKKKFC